MCTTQGLFFCLIICMFIYLILIVCGRLLGGLTFCSSMIVLRVEKRVTVIPPLTSRWRCCAVVSSPDQYGRCCAAVSSPDQQGTVLCCSNTSPDQ